MLHGFLFRQCAVDALEDMALWLDEGGEVAVSYCSNLRTLVKHLQLASDNMLQLFSGV